MVSVCAGLYRNQMKENRTQHMATCEVLLILFAVKPAGPEPKSQRRKIRNVSPQVLDRQPEVLASGPMLGMSLQQNGNMSTGTPKGKLLRNPINVILRSPSALYHARIHLAQFRNQAAELQRT